MQVQLTGYDAVAHLIPDKCEVSRDFLGVVARFQILGSAGFRQTLQ